MMLCLVLSVHLAKSQSAETSSEQHDLMFGSLGSFSQQSNNINKLTDEHYNFMLCLVLWAGYGWVS
jgi:hypothetical protein